MGIWDTVGGAIKDGVDWLDEKTNRDLAGTGAKLGNLGAEAQSFGEYNRQRYQALGNEATRARDYMRKIASGADSVSARQLQSSLQQNQSAQASMAAGARPANAAMAARTAAMTAGRQGAGLAGQQAVAGLQERQAAQKSLNEMLLRQRQQELSGALGSYGAASSAYGTALGAAMQKPTGLEKLGGALTGGLNAYLSLGSPK